MFLLGFRQFNDIGTEVILGIFVFKSAQDWKTASSIYDFTATDIDGNEVSLEKYR